MNERPGTTDHEWRDFTAAIPGYGVIVLCATCGAVRRYDRPNEPCAGVAAEARDDD